MSVCSSPCLLLCIVFTSPLLLRIALPVSCWQYQKLSVYRNFTLLWLYVPLLPLCSPTLVCTSPHTVHSSVTFSYCVCFFPLSLLSSCALTGVPRVKIVGSTEHIDCTHSHRQNTCTEHAQTAQRLIIHVESYPHKDPLVFSPGSSLVSALQPGTHYFPQSGVQLLVTAMTSLGVVISFVLFWFRNLDRRRDIVEYSKLNYSHLWTAFSVELCSRMYRN